MSFKELIKELDALNLPKDQYVVVGSGAMAAHNIREANDFDILPTWNLWEKLKISYDVVMHEGNENINLGSIQFLGRNNIFRDESICTLEEMIGTADKIEKINFLRLDLLKRYKTILGREKDLKDIELIDNYLKDSSTSSNSVSE